MSSNPSVLLANSLRHQQQPPPPSHFPTTYHQQYYHPSPMIQNDSLPSTAVTTGDHNDVSSTTTTVVLNALQAQSSVISPKSIQNIKNEVKTTSPSNPRRQATPHSPTCSSSSTHQYVMQTPSSQMDTDPNLQTSPILTSISPTSSTNLPSQPTLIDAQQSAAISSYPLSSTATSSTLKAFVCTCLKSHLVHEHNCPASNFIKPPLPSATIAGRPTTHRSLAQRAAVASQIRSNRTISMTPTKEQGQTSNAKSSELSPTNLTTILSQQQSLNNHSSANFSTVKQTIVRQRSAGSVNVRAKRRVIKQSSLPTGDYQDGLFCNLNDCQQQRIYAIKEEQSSPTNTILTSPRKLFSPFPAHSIQTSVSNSDIDQTIDEVINGKGDITVNDPPQPHTQQQQQQPQQHPSSQLVWVQNGTVTTKTWLSPLYQKQQQQQQQQQQSSSTFDPNGTTLTHQDVVNIAQQVVFPTVTEQNKISTVVLPAPVASNSKRRNRSKSTTNTTPKRNRHRQLLLHRPHSTTTSSQDLPGKSPVISPITPTLNLINKPIVWPTSSTSSDCAANGRHSVIANSTQSSMILDKNDVWHSQGVENVDTMLDEFQLVSIDEQRMHPNNPFDFDLSVDGFSSWTPPPPLPTDHQRYALSATDKLPSTFTSHGKLAGGDVDVYEHFLNPLPISSSSMWQENQVTSSVSTPPDFQLNPFPIQQQQQYYPPISDEHLDNLHSQVRLLFDVQS